MDDFEKSFLRIRKILKQQKWPGVEESTSYGTPSVKVKGKMLARIREPGVLVLMCNVEAKEMLMQVAPHIYFELPHYRGYPAVLVRMENIEDDEIVEMIDVYYRKIAPKKLLSEYELREQPVAKPEKKKATSKPKARAKTVSKKTTGLSAAKKKIKAKSAKPTAKKAKRK